ncbi:MAG: hypothetical protein ACI4TD_15145, partial [Phocaeicola sp.]
MIRKIFCTLVLFAAVSVTESLAFNVNPLGFNELLMPASNDGTYTRTQYSVTIYTENGHCKGSFSIYLHHGKKYISFNNTWICIQGKRAQLKTSVSTKGDVS